MVLCGVLAVLCAGWDVCWLCSVLCDDLTTTCIQVGWLRGGEGMVYYRNQIRVPHLKGDRFYCTATSTRFLDQSPLFIHIILASLLHAAAYTFGGMLC